LKITLLFNSLRQSAADPANRTSMFRENLLAHQCWYRKRGAGTGSWNSHVDTFFIGRSLVMDAEAAYPGSSAGSHHVPLSDPAMTIASQLQQNHKVHVSGGQFLL
jgi:hypothetical protein